MVKRSKNMSASDIGIQHILNNPNASFLTNPGVFHEITEHSKMTMTDMFRHIGHQKKTMKHKQPTDAELSQQRLSNLQNATEQKK